MDEFLREAQTLQKVVYKAKNAHRCTIYYKKTVYVNRLVKKYLKEESTTKKNIILEEIREGCMDAYVAISSNISLGHNLGLSIGMMAMVAKIHSLAKELKGTEAREGGIDRVRGVLCTVSGSDSTSEIDDISDIFNR